jgi:hypothetical protein
MAMGLLRWTTVAALTLGSAAGAQTVSLPLSRAIECLTPPASERGVPAYPAPELERRDGGTVRVELAFAGPEAAPRVRVLPPETFSGLVDSVRSHVRQLRVPCMAAGGEPVRLLQEYVFRPDDGRPVFASQPVDEADAERERQLACLMRVSPGTQPEYPRPMGRRDELQGSFLVQLRFDSPTAAPEVVFLAGPRAPHLRASVQAFVAGYRLPCLQGEPKSLNQAYVFKIERDTRRYLNDMQLMDFLRMARELPPARFDFDTMGCPFDLRISHYQPFAVHDVRQVGESRTERSDFLRWIARIQLRLTDNQAQDLLATDFNLSVPCGRLDL